MDLNEKNANGFTFFELIATLLLMSILFMYFIPKVFKTEKFEIESAVSELISNIEYTQQMSMRFYMTKKKESPIAENIIDYDVWGLKFEENSYRMVFGQDFDSTLKGSEFYKELDRSDKVSLKKYNLIHGYFDEDNDSEYTEVKTKNIKFKTQGCSSNNVILFDSLGRPVDFNITFREGKLVSFEMKGRCQEDQIILIQENVGEERKIIINKETGFVSIESDQDD